MALTAEKSSEEAYDEHACNLTFVGYVPEATVWTSRSNPRQAHKKSKTGCQRCRARKVKCNEVHPTCGGCEKHKVECVFDNAICPMTTGDQAPVESSNTTNRFTTTNHISADSLEESRKRRYLEIKLMQQWTTRTAFTFTRAAEPDVIVVMTVKVPGLALEHESLLFAIYAFSALHIAKTVDDSASAKEAWEAYRRYLHLAFREHQRNLAKSEEHNADVVCMTTVLLSRCTLAILQERLLEPYVPPSEWLRTMSGLRGLFEASRRWTKDCDPVIARSIIQEVSDLSIPADLPQEINIATLKYLFRRTSTEIEEEPWNDDIEAAYKTAISYIGGMRAAFETEDTTTEEMCRWIYDFY